MNKKSSRKADPAEFDQIFMMGNDVWAEGPESEYLDACRASPKYERGQWYVLESETSELLSSLIIYSFGPDRYGIGSIATPQALRKQGYASILISDVLKLIDEENPGSTIFLYSDIEPKFYKRFDFVQVPPSVQRYKTTTCMIRGLHTHRLSDKTDTPEYF